MDIRKILKELLGLESLPKGEGLVGFTDDQLVSAKKLLREIALYNKDIRNRDDLRAAVEAFEAVAEAVTGREKVAADTERDIEELSSRISAESDPEPEPTPEPTPDPEPEPEPEPAPEVKTPEPVMAATPEPEPKIEAPTVIVPEPTVSPAKTTEAPISLVASGDVKGHSAGQEMKADIKALTSAMSDKAASALRGQSVGRYGVGTMYWRDGYSEDRFLNDEDSTSRNNAKINAVVAAAQNQTREYLDRIIWERDPSQLASLVAAGGLCAPVNVRYELFTVGTTARPLRDALSRFGATRGGIRLTTPPTLQGDIAGTSAVNIYTETADTNSTGYPKGCLTVGCGDDVEVTVSAITLCMQVGNYQRLFNPENPAAWWQLGRVQHARIAEDAIWDRLDTLSTNVSAGEGLGATPDTLAQVERAAAQYRDRHRIDPSTPLRLVAPAFLRNILRVDLARRMPGDSTLAVSDGEIARYFAVRGIAITWVLDGQIAGGTSGYNQAAGALNPWPGTVDVAMFIDGTFLFLDGGSLDFGTEIRDFDLIRTNDVAMFMETFENVAFVGPESLMLTLDICPDGSSGGTDEDAISCVTGS